MRLFTIILSFYILLLNGIPCCAFDNCDDEQTEIAAIGKEHNKSEKKDCTSACSPFFCHTCSGIILTTFNFTHATYAIPVEKVYSHYRSPFYPQYAPSYWQPPDLAA